MSDPGRPAAGTDGLEVEPGQARAMQRDGARLVDVRAAAEQALGMPEGAQPLGEGDPVEAIARLGIGASDTLVCVCAVGQRSLRAAQALRAAGYRKVHSLRGGLAAWREEGLPETRPTGSDPEFAERYLRHLLLPEVGEAGQRRLGAATVLVVGAGGLGSPSALYLAAAGIGRLRIVDNDHVDRSNLQRQVLHTEDRIGMPKVESARLTLGALNPGVHIEPVEQRLGVDNVDRLLEGVDLVLDGADNFPARYLLNDACIRHRLPLVYGAVHRFEGQVSVFDAGRRRGESPCYRCLFPEPPPPESAPNCAEAGVLGVVPGLVGLLQATEAIKLLLGLGEPLDGRLLHVEVLGMRMRETRLRPDPNCPLCAPGRAFPGYIDYPAFCAGG